MPNKAGSLKYHFQLKTLDEFILFKETMITTLNSSFIQTNISKKILNEPTSLWIVKFMNWAQNLTNHKKSLKYCYLSNITKVK